MPGKFIVLQGLDRSGKSSLTKFISKQLYPDRKTKIGQLINQFLTNPKLQLSNQAIHLLFSANRWQTAEQLKTILNNGKNIVCDRYWYSGVAYSTAKGLDFQWCITPDKGLVEPDLVIYLKADPEYLAQRTGYGQQRFQKVDFQRKVGQSFQKIFQNVDQNKLAIIQVNDKTLEQVKAEVKKIINEKLI